MTDIRFLQEEGTNVFTGNELILKGALEAEVALMTGYPGSPVSDIFDAASANRELLKQKGILAEMANNEGLAVARLNGSRMAGVRAMAVMKSVGLHVASDGLALGNLAQHSNPGGGVVVVGDDPWIESTQINNDSRYLSQHLHMPVLEPATFQELKDWVGQAFELSSEADLYITYLVTTNQADGGGTVWLHPNRYPTVNTRQPITLESDAFQLDKTVLLPPTTWAAEETLPDRFQRVIAAARKRGLNRSLYETEARRPFGFVASGMAYCYLEHALAEMGLSGRVPVLKLGLSYPVDPDAVLAFARSLDSLAVIEEKRGFVETQIVTILQQAFQQGKMQTLPAVWGKLFPNGAPGIPETRGLNASLLEERLIPLFLAQWPDLSEADRRKLLAEQVLMASTTESAATLPVRTPTFCPGCPHRDSSSLFLEIKRDFKDPAYMKREHDHETVDLVFHGETGCFSMLMFEPNKPLMHNYSGMGLGGGTGAGLDPFITNKQVVFLGDSTFFHSGMVAISDSIKSGQDITYVILDNKTTAMTGHQPTPGTDLDLMGEKTFAQSIEAIVQAMATPHPPLSPVGRGIKGEGVKFVGVVNPEDRAGYRALLEETVLEGGVKIVIADKECGLTYHRREKLRKRQEVHAKGYLAEEHFINVTPEVCDFCLECTKNTGCPGLTIEQTLHGPKIVTDQTQCVSDGACGRVKACPSFEEVTVRRRAPAKTQAVLPPLDSLPLPSVVPVTSRWSAYTAAVGGMGAGRVSAVLVQAGHREGFRVLFLDKKGLAVRNGGVYGHLVFSREGGTLAPVVPYGKADLLLGIDLLESARSVDPKSTLRIAHPERTSAILNTAVNPTVRMLLGQDEPDRAVWESMLKRRLKEGHYWGADLSSISQHYFGSKLYANMLLLGAACQRGELPVSVESLEWAIAQSVSVAERDVNLQAFSAGRAVVLDPDRFQILQKVYTYRSLLEEKAGYLRTSGGARLAEAYRGLVGEAVEGLPREEGLHRQFALYVYDLIRYEGLPLARAYRDLILRVAQWERPGMNAQATRAVMENAFKVLAIKDEVFVAHLLTSPEKRARDQERFRIDPAAGDRLEYRHLNRPEFVLFGKSFRWDMRSRDWQLKLMRHMKFLRRWLPGWHRDEKQFRDWYLSLVEQYAPDTDTAYQQWVEILSSPKDVRGYREVRRPAQSAVRQKAEALLRQVEPQSVTRERKQVVSR